MRMPFGMFRGLWMHQIPTHGLEWMAKNLHPADHTDVLNAVEKELRLRAEYEPGISTADLERSDADLEQAADELLRKAGYDPDKVI